MSFLIKLLHKIRKLFRYHAKKLRLGIFGALNFRKELDFSNNLFILTQLVDLFQCLKLYYHLLY